MKTYAKLGNRGGRVAYRTPSKYRAHKAKMSVMQKQYVKQKQHGR